MNSFRVLFWLHFVLLYVTAHALYIYTHWWRNQQQKVILTLYEHDLHFKEFFLNSLIWLFKQSLPFFFKKNCILFNPWFSWTFYLYIYFCEQCQEGWKLTVKGHLFNPLTPMSDQDRISPYNINTISTRLVMRIEKNINLVIISWSNIKFSELTL